MISAGDFRNGVTFEMNDGSIVQIIEFQHVKPGKGAAFVRAKIRNVITEAVTETTFNPADKFPPPILNARKLNIWPTTWRTLAISWTMKPMNGSRSTRAFCPTPSNLSRRTRR